MSILFKTPIFLTIVWALGWLFVPDFSRSKMLRLWLSGVTGLLLLDLLAVSLLFTGLFQPLCLILGVGILFSLGVFITSQRRRNLVKGFGDAAPPSAGSKHRFELSVLIIAAVVIAWHTLFTALTPEVRSDPIRYHLRLANQYAVRGQIEPLKENTWWAIPQYGESLYAVGILLHNDTLAKVIHWFAGVLSGLGVFAVAKNWFGNRTAIWAALLWVTTPMVSYEVTTTYIEMILVVWVLVAVWLGAASLKAERLRQAGLFLSLSAFFVGVACGTKYTAFGVQAAPWLLFPVCFFWKWRRRFLQASGFSMLAGGAILLADSPWLLRNLYFTGNPVYPLFNRLLGINQEVDRGSELFFLTVWPGENLTSAEFHIDKIMNLLRAGYVFPGLAVLLPVILYLMRWKEGPEQKLSWSKRITLAYCGLSFIAYQTLTGNMDGRFWLPTLSIASTFLGYGMARLLDELETLAKRKSEPFVSTKPLTIALAFFLCLNYFGERWTFYKDFKESPFPILSEEARWAYYQEHAVGDPEGMLWEEIVPDDAFVYGLVFPYRKKYIHPLDEGAVDEEGNRLRANVDPVLHPFLESDQTVESLRRIALRAGLTHMFLPPEETARPQGFWTAARNLGSPVEGSKGRLIKINSGPGK